MVTAIFSCGIKSIKFGITHGIKLEDMNSNEPQKPQLNMGAVTHSRISGKTHIMVMRIKATIEQGGKVGVAGCKDPQPILDRLKALGTDAKAEPMIATQPLKAVYETDDFEEYIGGFIDGEKKVTGFIFYLL